MSHGRFSHRAPLVKRTKSPFVFDCPTVGKVEVHVHLPGKPKVYRRLPNGQLRSITDEPTLWKVAREMPRAVRRFRWRAPWIKLGLRLRGYAERLGRWISAQMAVR